MSNRREHRCPVEVMLATGEAGQCHRAWGHELGFLWTNRMRSQHATVVTIGGRSHPVTWYVRPDGIDIDVVVGRPR